MVSPCPMLEVELLVSTGSFYNDGSEDQAELLCVVSKERGSQDVASMGLKDVRGTVLTADKTSYFSQEETNHHG